MDERHRLLGVLHAAQDLGLIGPGSVEVHLEHSRAWADVLGPAPESFLDLGSGGGLPGLALAQEWPSASAVLLDSRQRAVASIEAAAAHLGCQDRVTAICERAEVAGRDPALREAFPLVVARGFGAPALTAECGSPFVSVGGRLSVSEPPGGDPERWPADRLAQLGLRPAGTRIAGSASFVILEKVEPLGEKWPRGKPHKRPLW